MSSMIGSPTEVSTGRRGPFTGEVESVFTAIVLRRGIAARPEGDEQPQEDEDGRNARSDQPWPGVPVKPVAHTGQRGAFGVWEVRSSIMATLGDEGAACPRCIGVPAKVSTGQFSGSGGRWIDSRDLTRGQNKR
jgi:hypothetical protein